MPLQPPSRSVQPRSFKPQAKTDHLGHRRGEPLGQRVLMYIRRWLEAPVQMEDGSIKYSEGRGTPQGGVISPILANLYLHYCVDKWMEFHYKSVVMARYADDLIIHCKSQMDATLILESLKERLSVCGLRAHPEKTKIVYCKKEGRNLKGHPVQFDFLGFSRVGGPISTHAQQTKKRLSLASVCN